MLDRRTLLLSSAAALTGCASAPKASPANDATFVALVERLANATPAERRDALTAVDPETLTFDGRLLHEAVIYGAKAEADLAARAYGAGGRPYPVTHRSGAYRRIPADLGVDAVALAQAIDADTDQIEANAAIGATPPDFIIDRTLAAIVQARQPLMLARDHGAAAVGEAVTRQTQTLERLRTNASSDAGVGRLPDGEDFYSNALTLAIGARYAPRYVHDVAQEQCAHFRREAFRLLQASGHNLPRNRIDLAPALRAFAAREEYLYSNDDAGKSRAVADMNATLARIRMLLPKAFDGLETTTAEVRRMSAEDEARGASGRRDGGAYIVDLRNIRDRPAWTLPSVVAHETLPGHALQAPFQRSASPARLQTRYSNGYSEGWAIYAEVLTDELGLYEERPRDRLGYVHWMLFRWGRVLIDTGINAMGWARARALNEWESLQGFDIAFATMADEVDRVCIEPGAFSAQAMTALHILDERENATRRYATFDLRRFHEAVLKYGPLPPSALSLATRHAFEN